MTDKYTIITNTEDSFKAQLEDRSYTVIAAAKYPNGTWSVYLHAEHMHINIATYKSKKTAVKKVIELVNSTMVY